MDALFPCSQPWRRSSLTAAHGIACAQGHTAEVTGIAWSPDGQSLATACDDRTVRVRGAGARLWVPGGAAGAGELWRAVP